MKILIISILLLSFVLAEERINNSEECYACASSYQKVCKDPNNLSIRYCCSMFDYTEKCGGNLQDQCTSQITDEGDYSGTGAHYLMCEDGLNECNLKTYYAYTGYYSNFYESNLQEEKACIIKFKNYEDEGASMKIKNIYAYGLQAYVYTKDDGYHEMYKYHKTINEYNEDKTYIKTNYDEPLFLVIAPENSFNSLQFDYKMADSGLAAGAIVGIVLGSIAGALLCICCVCCIKKKRQQRRLHLQTRAQIPGGNYMPNASNAPASQYIAVQSEPNPGAYPQNQVYTSQPRYVPQVNQVQQNQVLPPYPVAQPPPQNPQSQPLLTGVNTSQPSAQSSSGGNNNYIPLTPAYPVETRRD